MKIGFFTDTYFPQVSGVATSIQTLKEELERQGHSVYIFTTTDPDAPTFEEGIIRMPSIPFVSFKDRRIVVRGLLTAYSLAKNLELDIIHTHTEFGMGWLGKFVAKHLRIPCVHTYHTMYEDYLHYIAKGKIIRPLHVRQYIKAFCRNLSGIICPSQRVVDSLSKYDVVAPFRVIPTGVDIRRFQADADLPDQAQALRQKLGIGPEEELILSLSRLSYEKNIQALIQAFPAIVAARPKARFVIVGDGPYRAALEALAVECGVAEVVQFVGEVANTEVSTYYHASDLYVNASTSESQGLTYIEAIACGTPVIAQKNAYLETLIDHPMLGELFTDEALLAQTVVNYLAQKIEVDETCCQTKLQAISSEQFGLNAIQFYHYARTHYNDFVETDERKLSNRITVKLFRNRS